MTAIDHAKRTFWRAFIYPVFPFFREFFILFRKAFGHHHRDPFMIGVLRSECTFEEFIAFLQSQGFRNHFIAWRDPGQVASLRVLDGFRWQYHLRLFKDGEVRGHYERTPEASPIDHFFARGIQARRDEFLRMLEDWIVPVEPEAVRAAS
jgi:hypothetical protein